MDELELGKTGEYPQGKLNKDDEGEIKLAVYEEKGKIVINFGTPVVWLAFDKEQAIALADVLMERATGFKF